MPRKKSTEAVSLFPFMSILACVIGILMLMITAAALAQIGKDKVQGEDAAEQARLEAEAQQRIGQYRALQSQITATAGEADRLAEMLERGDRVAEQLAAARAELERLTAQQAAAADRARQQDSELARQQAEAERLQRLIEQLESDLAALLPAIDQLKAELAEREKPPQPAQVIVQPSGSGSNLKPTFVECAVSSVVLHEGPQPKRIPRSQLAQNEDFARLLENVKSREGATVIFLVRPDGIGTYNSARHIARTRYVRNGKLAIASQGEIDLSRYEKR